MLPVDGAGDDQNCGDNSGVDETDAHMVPEVEQNQGRSHKQIDDWIHPIEATTTTPGAPALDDPTEQRQCLPPRQALTTAGAAWPSTESLLTRQADDDQVQACAKQQPGQRHKNDIHTDSTYAERAPARSKAANITSSGAGTPVQRSNDSAACRTSIPRPSRVAAPACAASRSNLVGR
jgi:hypothetical protein